MFVSFSSEGQVSVGGDQLAEVLHAPHVIDLPARHQLILLVSIWGLLEPSRRGGENAQKTGENGGKMSEIWSKTCEQGKQGGITWEGDVHLRLT